MILTCVLHFWCFCCFFKTRLWPRRGAINQDVYSCFFKFSRKSKSRFSYIYIEKRFASEMGSPRGLPGAARIAPICCPVRSNVHGRLIVVPCFRLPLEFCAPEDSRSTCFTIVLWSGGQKTRVLRVFCGLEAPGRSKGVPGRARAVQRCAQGASLKEGWKPVEAQMSLG